jgi:hypothetical protein
VVHKSTNEFSVELTGIYDRCVSLVAWKWLNAEENTQYYCQNNRVSWQNAHSLMAYRYVPSLPPCSCKIVMTPYSSHFHFHRSLRSCQIPICLLWITSTLFLLRRSSDRHFYQRWFIGYQSIRHRWWVDRNWLVFVTYCSAHAPLFQCRIDDDTCLRKVDGENEMKWNEMQLEREDVSEEGLELKWFMFYIWTITTAIWTF